MFSNITVDNTILVLQALLKVATFMWPIIVVGIVMLWWSERESAH